MCDGSYTSHRMIDNPEFERIAALRRDVADDLQGIRDLYDTPESAMEHRAWTGRQGTHFEQTLAGRAQAAGRLVNQWLADLDDHERTTPAQVPECSVPPWLRTSG